MKPEFEVLTETVTSAGAITACRLVDNAGAQIAAANSAAVLGVARADAGGANERTPVGTLGIYVCEAGGAIAKGAPVASDASGRVVTTTAANPIVGFAREAASGAGAKILVAIGFGPALPTP